MGFLALLGASCFYAVGRYIYEAFVKRDSPTAEPAAAGIPFHTAVRLADKVFRERYARECDTVVMVLPRNPDGTLAAPEPPANPGAGTVDVHGRAARAGRHRSKYIGCASVVSRMPEAA